MLLEQVLDVQLFTVQRLPTGRCDNAQFKTYNDNYLPVLKPNKMEDCLSFVMITSIIVYCGILKVNLS